MKFPLLGRYAFNTFYLSPLVCADYVSAWLSVTGWEYELFLSICLQIYPVASNTKEAYQDGN